LSTVAVGAAKVSRVMNIFMHSSVWVLMGSHPLYPWDVTSFLP